MREWVLGPEGMLKFLTDRPGRLTKHHQTGLTVDKWNVCDSETLFVLPSSQALAGWAGAWLAAVVIIRPDGSAESALWSPMFARGGLAECGIVPPEGERETFSSLIDALSVAERELKHAVASQEVGRRRFRWWATWGATAIGAAALFGTVGLLTSAATAIYWIQLLLWVGVHVTMSKRLVEGGLSARSGVAEHVLQSPALATWGSMLFWPVVLMGGLSLLRVELQGGVASLAPWWLVFGVNAAAVTAWWLATLAAALCGARRSAPWFGYVGIGALGYFAASMGWVTGGTPGI